MSDSRKQVPIGEASAVVARRRRLAPALLAGILACPVMLASSGARADVTPSPTPTPTSTSNAYPLHWEEKKTTDILRGWNVGSDVPVPDLAGSGEPGETLTLMRRYMPNGSWKAVDTTVVGSVQPQYPHEWSFSDRPVRNTQYQVFGYGQSTPVRTALIQTSVSWQQQGGGGTDHGCGYYDVELILNVYPGDHGQRLVLHGYRNDSTKVLNLGSVKEGQRLPSGPSYGPGPRIAYGQLMRLRPGHYKLWAVAEATDRVESGTTLNNRRYMDSTPTKYAQFTITRSAYQKAKQGTNCT